jgi:dTDP-4-amino-4,6-dideoxygalactose transaminase
MADCKTIAFARPYFGDEEAAAAAETVRSTWVVGGPRLAEFERRFAELCGAAHAVGVSSWTTGGFLVLKALDIGAGDEVIVQSLTFIASVNVIVHAGATPFLDVDPRHARRPDDVARKIEQRQRSFCQSIRSGYRARSIGSLRSRNNAASQCSKMPPAPSAAVSAAERSAAWRP